MPSNKLGMMGAAGQGGEGPKNLYAWGENGYGQIGNGSGPGAGVQSPVQIGGLEWLGVGSSGSGHAMALKDDYTLWGWGDSEYGKTGQGNETDLYTPTQVGTDTYIDVACNQAGTTAVSESGKLYACGQASHPRIGQPYQEGATYLSLTQIGTKTNWVSVSGTHDHIAAIDADGKLYTWGQQTNGNLGHGTSGGNVYAPTQVGSLTDWASVSCGQSHTVALKTDGTVWVWGNNQYGALGIGNTTHQSSPVLIGAAWAHSGTSTTWAHVSASGYITHVADSVNTLWAMGWARSFGSLGNHLTNNNAWTTPDNITVYDLEKRFQGGGAHSVALKTDGTLWSWGNNAAGQIGIGNTTNQSFPVQVGNETDWTGGFTGFSTSFGFRGA